MATNSSNTAIIGNVSGAFPDGLTNVALAKDAAGNPVGVSVAAFTDADATTLGEGSLVLDPTLGAGKVGVVSNGLIQTLALA